MMEEEEEDIYRFMAAAERVREYIQIRKKKKVVSTGIEYL
jgi:hypothetical protein